MCNNVNEILLFKELQQKTFDVSLKITTTPQHVFINWKIYQLYGSIEQQLNI